MFQLYTWCHRLWPLGGVAAGMQMITKLVTLLLGLTEDRQSINGNILSCRLGKTRLTDWHIVISHWWVVSCTAWYFLREILFDQSWVKQIRGERAAINKVQPGMIYQTITFLLLAGLDCKPRKKIPPRMIWSGFWLPRSVSFILFADFHPDMQMVLI